MAQDKDGKIIGKTPDGRIVVEHDGVSEVAICAECGATLDGVSDQAPTDWDGSCWVCGAPRERVGLVMECVRARLHEDGNGWPEEGDYVYDPATGQAYRVIDCGDDISTHGPGTGNSIMATLRPVELRDSDWDEVVSVRVVLLGPDE